MRYNTIERYEKKEQDKDQGLQEVAQAPGVK